MCQGDSPYVCEVDMPYCYIYFGFNIASMCSVIINNQPFPLFFMFPSI